MKYLMLSLTASVVLLGCDSSELFAPTGGLTGKVSLYDTRSQKMLNASGVLVQLQGTAYSALSDSAGNWTIQDMAVGEYTAPVVFSKNGFSAKKMFHAFSIPDSVVPYPVAVELYSPLPFSVVLDSISPPQASPKKSGYFSGHFVGAPLEDRQDLMAIVLYSTSPTMRLWDSTTYIGGLAFMKYFFTLKDSVLYFESHDWEQYGPFHYGVEDWVESGKKVYLQAFPYYWPSARKYDMQYFDADSGRWETTLPYTSSPVYSVTVP